MNDQARSLLEEARGLMGECQELKRRVGMYLLATLRSSSLRSTSAHATLDKGGAGPSAAGWGGAVPPSHGKLDDKRGGGASADSAGGARPTVMKDLSQALTEASEALKQR